MVLEQIKLTLKSFSVLKNQHEALVTFDFDKSKRREALMRLCFSPLAAWPLFVILVLFLLNPLRYQFSLTQALGMENILVQTLFGMDWLYAAVLCGVFFALSYFTRKEFLWLGIIGFLLAQGDLHLLLALTLVACVLAARLMINFRCIRFLESYTKSVLLVTLFLSLVAWALAVHLSFELYKALLQAGYFSASMFANRLETFILVVALYYGLELFVLSVWGHFYTKRNPEPSEFAIQYSTALILSKLSLGIAFKALLKEQVAHKQNNKPIYEKADLDLLPKRLVELHRKEESFLTKALSVLT